MKRDRSLKRLQNSLAIAVESEFFQMIWAVDALRRKNGPDVQAIFSHPKEAKGVKIGDKYAIYPWDLEDLLNAELVTKKSIGKRNRKWNCSEWGGFAEVLNRLKKNHDLDYEQNSVPENILDTLAAIGHKQFRWQRGYFNYNTIYRSAVLYSGAETQGHLRKILGCSLNDFSFCGFALVSNFLGSPKLELPPDASELGICPETMEHVISHISKPIDTLRNDAKHLRKDGLYNTYSPSILRQFPCAVFDEQQLMCPLIDLLVYRFTEGVYYDAISGPDAIRNEIGSNFENYVLSYLEKSFQEFSVSGEIEYGKKGHQTKSPDILIQQNKEITLLVECKATRMPFDSKFKQADKNKETEKSTEIAKGIFQIWRFYAHIRCGKLNGFAVNENALGVVVTLDAWTTMNHTKLNQIRGDANSLAKKDSSICDADRKPVAVCHIDDFESLLRDSTESTFLDTIRSSITNKFAGWNLYLIHKEKYPQIKEAKPFPFKEDIGNVLPWYQKLEQQG